MRGEAKLKIIDFEDMLKVRMLSRLKQSLRLLRLLKQAYTTRLPYTRGGQTMPRKHNNTTYPQFCSI